MPHPDTVPALLELFEEFDKIAPGRDKSSDGTIGDQAHRDRSSDHNLDDGPNQGATPYEDSDDDPEIHAADFDANLRHPFITMQLCANVIVDRHRRGVDDRAQNVIFNGQIASRSWGWTWRTYTGADPHTGHMHVSLRYTAAQEKDRSPWGLLERFEDDMDKTTFTNYLRAAVRDDAQIRYELARAVATTDNVVNINDPDAKPDAGLQSLIRWGSKDAEEAAAAAKAAGNRVSAVEAKVDQLLTLVQGLAGAGEPEGGTPAPATSKTATAKTSTAKS